jgi:hypothetical protein
MLVDQGIEHAQMCITRGNRAVECPVEFEKPDLT